VSTPWEAGFESMITGFYERFNPARDQEPRRQTVSRSVVRPESVGAFKARQKVNRANSCPYEQGAEFGAM